MAPAQTLEAPSNPWSRLSRKIREVGLRHTIELLAWSIFPPAVFRFVRMRVLELAPSTAEPSGEAYWAKGGDAALQAFGHTPETIARRLADGARVCVASDSIQTLGYVWFESPHLEEDLGLRFIMGERETWLYDAMVNPECRGRGIYPRLVRRAAYDLGRDGIERILIAVETVNRNSIRSHQAAGATIIGTITSLRLLGMTIAHYGRGWRVGFGALPLSARAME